MSGRGWNGRTNRGYRGWRGRGNYRGYGRGHYRGSGWFISSECAYRSDSSVVGLGIVGLSYRSKEMEVIYLHM